MDNVLVLSSNSVHGKYLPRFLAGKLEKNGIPVLLTPICWPRDELVFFNDGSYDYVQKDTDEDMISPNFAWHGGTFLKGDNFIIGSLTANPTIKQKATEDLLNVKEGFYFNIEEELNALSRISVSKQKEFYSAGFPHMDQIYNIGNTYRRIFTYEHPLLIKKGKEISDKCGYFLETIPLEEASFASIGFVEFGEKVILDNRARKTKKLLERLGYKVITTPLALIKTNNHGGSLRCITTEMPIDYFKLKKINPDKANREERFMICPLSLSNLKGENVLTEKGRIKQY